MTRLFDRNKNNKTTIAELEEYYANQNQKKSSTIKTWLMAILSILITVLVIVLLFLAGRWLYQAVTDNDSDNSTTSETETSNDINVILPTFDGDNVGRGNSSVDSSGNDSSASETNGGTVSDQAASTSESNADRVAASNDSTANESSTGTTAGESVAVGGEVPNTGAGEILVLAPIISGVLGYFVYRKKQIKNYN